MLAVSALTVLLLVLAVVPMLSASNPKDEIEEATPSPSPEEDPFFDDEGYFSNDKEYWFAGRNVPATGSPHLLTQELVNKPLAEVYSEGGGKPALINQVRYSEASWIHASIENANNPTKLDDNSREEFFAFYDKQDVFTPYFEVTFSDGSVKYYEVMFIEVP
jgi:hypothetical protein